MRIPLLRVLLLLATDMSEVRLVIQSSILKDAMFGCESVRSENVQRLAKKVLEATATDDVKGNILRPFHQT